MNTTVDNDTSAVVEALSTNGTLVLDNVTINGGTLESGPGATIKSQANSINVLDQVQIFNSDTFLIESNSELIVQPSSTAGSPFSFLGNVGLITLDGEIEIENNSLSLVNGGQVTMETGSKIFGNGDGVTLTNDNIISGTGSIGEGQMGLVNDDTIDASAAGGMVIDTGANAVTNTSNGILEGSAASGLDIISSVINNNTTGQGIWATAGGSVTIAYGITGGGNTTIDNGSLVAFGSAANEAVRFTNASGDSGTLQLDRATTTNFSGTVAGFAGTSHTNSSLSDTIDIRNIVQATASFTWTQGSGQGVLQVTDGTRTADLTLIGTYASTDFGLKNDGNGGAMVLTSNSTNHL
jgi:hypothetical protein